MDQCRTWFWLKVSGVHRAAGAGKLLCISRSSLERLIGVEGAGVGNASIRVRWMGSGFGGMGVGCGGLAGWVGGGCDGVVC